MKARKSTRPVKADAIVAQSLHLDDDVEFEHTFIDDEYEIVHFLHEVEIDEDHRFFS